MDSISSKDFLYNLFNKITETDFKTDAALNTFYNIYKKKNQEENIDLFKFYFQYLIRNREDLNTIELQEKEIYKLYDIIKNNILYPQTINNKDSDEINPRFKLLESKKNDLTFINKEIINPINNQNINIKLDKVIVLDVLSEYIKNSFIINNQYIDVKNFNNEKKISDEKQNDDINQENDIHTNNTNIIMQEIISEYGNIPTAIKDQSFKYRNDMIEIWKNTESYIEKISKNEKMLKLFNEIYLIDNNDININNDNIPILNPKNVDQYYKFNILKKINSKYKAEMYNTIITIIQNDTLSETIIKANNNINAILIANEMEFIPGGNSDQGTVTKITPLYFSSTYSLGLSKVEHIYPLGHNYLIFIPNVLVFKNHKDLKYNNLNSDKCTKISVLASAPKYKPKSNINNQDKYNMDEKLYLSDTKFIDVNIFKNQLIGIFNTTLMLGYTTIIIDDRGVEDNWAPVVHSAIILSQVINMFKGKFKEIIVAIKEPHLYKIFKKYIS